MDYRQLRGGLDQLLGCLRVSLPLGRHDRDQSAVDAALARVRSEAADPNVNLMPALIDAVKVYATLGEIMGTMESEFGRHVEVPVI